MEGSRLSIVFAHHRLDTLPFTLSGLEPFAQNLLKRSLRQINSRRFVSTDGPGVAERQALVFGILSNERDL